MRINHSVWKLCGLPASRRDGRLKGYVLLILSARCLAAGSFLKGFYTHQVCNQEFPRIHRTEEDFFTKQIERRITEDKPRKGCCEYLRGTFEAVRGEEMGAVRTRRGK